MLCRGWLKNGRTKDMRIWAVLRVRWLSGGALEFEFTRAPRERLQMNGEVGEGGGEAAVGAAKVEGRRREADAVGSVGDEAGGDG